MVGLGYHLYEYEEVWSDQPPGMTVLLRGVYAALGLSVAAARGMVWSP
jgi:hypothetical protein